MLARHRYPRLTERQRDILAALVAGQRLQRITGRLMWRLIPSGWWVEKRDLAALIHYGCLTQDTMLLTDLGRSECWAWPNPAWPERPFPPSWPLEVTQALSVFNREEQQELWIRFDGSGLGFYRTQTHYPTESAKVAVLFFFEEAWLREQAGLEPFPPLLRLPQNCPD